jgi:hypothetical protein
MPDKNNPEVEIFIAGFKKKAIEAITSLNGTMWQSRTWDHK